MSPEDSLNVVALSAFCTSAVVNKLKVLIGIFFCRILFRLVLELHLLSGDLLILTVRVKIQYGLVILNIENHTMI